MAVSRCGFPSGYITAGADVAGHGLLLRADRRLAFGCIAAGFDAIETIHFGGAWADSDHRERVGVRWLRLGCVVQLALVELYGHGRPYSGGLYVVGVWIPGLGPE